MPNQEALEFNGVNASTGGPLHRALSLEEVTSLACGEDWDPQQIQELREKKERDDEDGYVLRFGLESNDLAQAGWGVIFTPEVSDKVREALKPLLDHRKSQAGEYYKELIYRPKERQYKFLARYGAGPGPADPENVPYYLLIVGSPEEIPFRFQYQLDVQYAVGRLHFDTVEEYAHYAENVVDVENENRKRPKSAAFFGVANRDDRATQRSCHDLTQPLVNHLEERVQDWGFESVLGEMATKDQLSKFLGGESTPAFLFTASHGVGFDLNDELQLSHQGALLCQDWPGPREWKKRVPPGFYMSADDIDDSADVTGLIAFHFACYGAGTPKCDQFTPHRKKKEHQQLAPHDFVAGLPRRLLAHPKGGALAVIGHVDRAWTYAFDWPQAVRTVDVDTLTAFESVFEALFEGHSVGAATEFFNQRYAELSSALTMETEEVKYGAEPDILSVSGLWTANNDARSYIVLGDPAVRLAV